MPKRVVEHVKLCNWKVGRGVAGVGLLTLQENQNWLGETWRDAFGHPVLCCSKPSHCGQAAA
jgi:hypothetical protein